MQIKRQTLATAYDELASGERFRIAIGNFMNAFFLYEVAHRQALLNDPIRVPENPTRDQCGWAAFCAGTAEYLAERYDLLCPDWAQDVAYNMPDSWYTLPSEENPDVCEIFQATTPDAFKRRNVFCGVRVFTNQHPSSREPGSLTDLQRHRMEKLVSMTPAERQSYQKQMAGKPRVHIVA